ncbi:hypothetical protein DL768_010804 [Monosporascus sp. mg162]|nr:hypothetical protein DL768_010804 [Monosporascus sp. mg162]
MTKPLPQPHPRAPVRHVRDAPGALLSGPGGIPAQPLRARVGAVERAAAAAGADGVGDDAVARGVEAGRKRAAQSTLSSF